MQMFRQQDNRKKVERSFDLLGLNGLVKTLAGEIASQYPAALFRYDGKKERPAGNVVAQIVSH